LGYCSSKYVPYPFDRRIDLLLGVGFFSSTSGTYRNLPERGIKSICHHYYSQRFVDAGFSLSLSAGYWGMMLGIGIAGRIGVGELTDRLNPQMLFFISLSCMGAASLLMFFPGVPTARIVFIVLFGISQASVSTLLPLIVQKVFGAESFSKVYGPIGLCISFAVAGGNYAGGYLKDVTGNYHTALIITAGLGTAAFTASRFIRPVKI
jgi:predicted MFS family arabinose efflux permease